MKKTIEVLQAQVSALTHEGRGISHYQGKPVFIENALPTEVVDFEIVKRHSRYAEGKVTRIHTESEMRVNPACEHFTVCGGCSLQHMSSVAQIELKQKTLLEQLAHFGNLSPKTVLSPLTAPIWGYRRKARLGVRFVEKKQRLLIGFREKQGRYLAELTRCAVLDPRVGELITPLRELISGLSVMKEIAQIEVSMGDTAVALVFRNLKPLTDNDVALLKAFGEKHHIQIYMQPGGIESVALLTEENKEALSYQITAANVSLHFDPLDFTQVNAGINQQMVPLAMDLLNIQANDIILDLFCGLGNFSIPMARHALKVVGVEGDLRMVEKAKENAKQNRVENIEFFDANLFDETLDPSWGNHSYTKLLLDPPRSGALAIVSQIKRWLPEKIVYVSCNPATFARDAGILVNENKYTLSKVGILDMFPHTAHCESIALFERK